MDAQLATVATEIARRIQQAGFAAYWVGGCVRDFLLGREPRDYDVATNATPELIERLFLKTIPVGRQFGVVLVLEQGFEFQVATFRSESGYTDGRHPGQVTFGDPAADASRRDFTVNGLYYDPGQKVLHDWVGGEADLKSRVLRAIGNPAERFAEDHLRLLRAVRLAAQLGFEIEPATLAAVKQNPERVMRVSAERIRDELLKLFCPPHAARGLDLLRETGLLAHVLPEIAATIECAQSPQYHPEGSVYNHIRLMLSNLPAECPAMLPWAVLLHDVAKPVTATRDEVTGQHHFYTHEKVGAEMTETILRRLRFSNQEIADVKICVYHHMQFKDAREMRKSSLRRMLMRPTFPLELELHKLDCLGSHQGLELYDFLKTQQAELAQQPEVLPPLLTGHDLQSLGLKPGPAMGRVMAELREKQLQDELKTAEEARAWVLAQKTTAASLSP
ncbi:MAG: CCA tRNA nucleotidyltransferase [Verrucomicrobiota bacterium]